MCEDASTKSCGETRECVSSTQTNAIVDKKEGIESPIFFYKREHLILDMAY